MAATATRTEALRRRRVDRDRRLARGPLAVLRRGRRPRREGGRRRGAPRGRRRRARDARAAARAQARRDPRPRRRRARPPPRGGRADDLRRGRQAAEGRARRGGRAMSTYTFAAVEARKLAGEMVPMDASQAGEGKLAFTLRRPIGVVGAISPFNFPLNLVAHKIAPALAAGCAVVLKPASPDAALGAPARRARGGGGPAAGLAQRARRPVVRDRRRPRRGRARQADHVHGLGRRRLEAAQRAPRKRVNLELGNATPVIVAADADVDDGRGEARRERVLLRRPELHLRAADLRRARGVRRVRRALPAAGRGARGRRPGRRGHRRRPA